MADEVKIGEVFLKDVRLTFWHGFTPKKFTNRDGTETYKYTCSFLLPKDNSAKARYPGPKGKVMPALTALKMAKEAMLRKEMGADFNVKKLEPQNYCVRDGDLKLYDGYEGNYYVACSNNDRFPVVDQLRQELTQADGKPYSGSYDNALVRLWVQKPGKAKDGSPIPLRVNASIEAIQFWRDGDAFGRTHVDPMDVFEDMEGVEIGGDDDDDDDMI